MALSPGDAARGCSIRFAKSQDIVDFFTSTVHSHFIDWFNANVANRANWKSKAMHGSDGVRKRFEKICDAIPIIFPESPINLFQFLALIAVIINEAGPDLMPGCERCGTTGFPGLAYAFSGISGVKQSYNSGPLNKLAGSLFFDDANYWNAHGSKAGGSAVRGRPDLRSCWDSTTFPVEHFSPAIDPGQPGFIEQADFYKFRGRGLIQVTWRANYKKLVKFIQSYSGANPVLLYYRQAWAGKDADLVCTISSNKDWDALLLDSELTLACKAIGIHSALSGDYLTLSSDANILSALAPTPGSIFYMGYRIGGGRNYAALFTARVLQLISALPLSA